MAGPAPSYQKLPGRGLRRGAFGLTATRCRLWLGEDHLLAVDFTVATEEYRRFYFRDIEAVIIRRTAARQIANWVLGVLAVLTATPFLVAYRTDGSSGALAGAIIGALFWLVFLLINTVRGATCRVYIRTAAQLEQLPSLGRLPLARKVLGRLQPLIVAAQGVATPEDLATAEWEWR